MGLHIHIHLLSPTVLILSSNGSEQLLTLLTGMVLEYQAPLPVQTAGGKGNGWTSLGILGSPPQSTGFFKFIQMSSLAPTF